METTEKGASIVPLHQWTDNDGYVLLVKCVTSDMTSYGGFAWPESGPVKPDAWSRKATCESGGLFGWPLGIGVGLGKDIIPNGRWLVFRAKPENVINIEYGKAKAVPGEDGSLPEVVYCGTMAGAMLMTMKHRQAWIEHASRGSASASGDNGSASVSGYRGSASASGYNGSASASGDNGSASASGDRGSASASGDRGSASATGSWSSAQVSGNGGIATSSYRAMAGEEGCFVIRWHDGERWQFAFGEVGKDGIDAGVWYVVHDGKLTKE